jgi:transcriptional regulator GlxA family with amidase domain
MSAGVDLALALLADDLRADLARRIAKILVVYHRRAGGLLRRSESLLGNIRRSLAFAFVPTNAHLAGV